MSTLHSDEAEKTLIGQMIEGGADLVSQVSAVVSPDDFHRDAHGRLYRLILGMLDKGEPIELVALAERVVGLGLADAVGGLSYVAGLPDMVASLENWQHYARIVRGMKVRRDLQDAARTVAACAEDMSSTPREALDRAGSAVLSIDGEGEQAGGWIPASVATLGALEEVEARVDRDGAIEVSTGLREVDTMLAGLHRTDLVILAARPAMGKTALALKIARSVADQGLSVGFFSLEMSAAQLVTRLMVAESRVYAGKVRTGDLNDRDLDALNRAASVVHDLPLHIDETPGVTITQLRSRARRLRAMCPDLALIVVDYIGLMEGEGAEGRQQQISNASRGLKVMAKELGVCVLALSQLNRNVEHRKPPIPQLSDLRESGAIEQDADVVAFLYRDDYYHPETSTRQGEADLIVAKQRNGPTGAVPLAFEGAFTTFSDLITRDLYD